MEEKSASATRQRLRNASPSLELLKRNVEQPRGFEERIPVIPHRTNAKSNVSELPRVAWQDVAIRAGGRVHGDLGIDTLRELCQLRRATSALGE
jgi:hypothetical protein